MSQSTTVSPTRRSSSPIASLAALGLAAALAAAGGGCRDYQGVHYEEQSQTTVPLAPQTRLLIENARGSVRLVSGDSGAVRIEAHKRAYAISEQRAKRLAAEVKVHVDRIGDRLEIRVEYPRRITSTNVRVEVFGHNMARRRADVELVIAVPRGVPTRVETRSADLFVDDTSGPLEFETTSGDASVEKHGGPLTVHSTSGDVTVTLEDGECQVNSTSGNMSAEKISGNLSYKSTSGDLSVDDVDGTLIVTTVSGDVTAGRVRGTTGVTTVSGDVELHNAPGDLRVSSSSGDVTGAVQGEIQNIAIETTSGDVDLKLPENLRGRLEVRTSSGEVEAHLPMTLERATRRQLDAVLGAGSQTTSVHTSSGDVVIGFAAAEKP